MDRRRQIKTLEIRKKINPRQLSDRLKSKRTNKKQETIVLPLKTRQHKIKNLP